MISTILLISLLSTTATVTVGSGVSYATPPGFVVANYDPNLTSSLNNQYYDPNFIPGFQVGLTNTSISWRSGVGYGDIGYDIGPWSHEEQGLPHLAVGPQCCNFVEVQHTQQFRAQSWGDYYYVRAGFSPPGVNVQNYTANFKTPADVGLRTDWNWTVQVSLDWNAPDLLDHGNEWAAFGIAATQYVPGFPGNLVYTVVDFWMDENSSSRVVPSPDGVSRSVNLPNVVLYHPVQLSGSGNQTLTFNLSPYLVDTLKTLGIQSSLGAPVISYVYLNVEGYNFDWNGTIWTFKVIAPNPILPFPLTVLYLLGGAVGVSVISLLLYRHRVRGRGPAEAV